MGGEDRWRKHKLLQQIANGETSLDKYSPEDLRNVAERAMLAKNIFEKPGKSKLEKELLKEDLRTIRRAIYYCFSTNKEEHAAALVDGIVKSPGTRDKENDERIATAIGALSAFSTGGASGNKRAVGIAKEKLLELLGEKDPSIQIAVIKNLTNGDDFEIFEKVALLLKDGNPRLRAAALRHVETIICEVAFRGGEGERLAPEVVEFLKKTLKLMEHIQTEVMATGDGETVKRLTLIIILTYNHILADMYREAEMTGGREMRPYMAVLEHFTSMAPVSVKILARRLSKTPSELGMDAPLDTNIKTCVIDAMERMGANDAARPRIITTLKDLYWVPSLPESLRGRAKKVVDNLENKNFRYSVLPKPPEARQSIVPGPHGTLRK